MSSGDSPDYKALFFAESDRRKRAEERQRQAEEKRQQAEEERRQSEERTRSTTFDEYLRACHTLLSAPLQVEHPSRSTKGDVTTPTGKYCPTSLRAWADFPTLQVEVYKTVRRFLQPIK